MTSLPFNGMPNASSSCVIRFICISESQPSSLKRKLTGLKSISEKHFEKTSQYFSATSLWSCDSFSNFTLVLYRKLLLSSLTTLAGFPITVTFSGTSLNTIAPIETTLSLPICILSFNIVPLPMKTSSPITTCPPTKELAPILVLLPMTES